MKLYFSRGACSLASHIVLLEAGQEFTTERVDLGKKLTASGADFRAINPKGCVPALELKNGTVLTEGAAILQFIADLAPATLLMPPPGTFERYQVLEWLNFIATELHKNFSPLFNPAYPAEAKTVARTILTNRLAYVGRMLEGREYLVGAQFTTADAYLFTVLSWTDHVQVDLADWPTLQAFQARVAERPAVQQALRGERL